MISFRSARPRWRTIAAVTVAVAMSTTAFASTASALTQYWTGGSTIPVGGRSIGPYKYLYGVGYESFPVTGPSDSVCVGAKTNADGSGGNAIPFTCATVPANGVQIWTPGGQSNYGYPTVINMDSHPIFGGGLMNFRP